MPHQITIQPSGHSLQAQADETILQAALREGYALPYGCRNGACGACKGKVLEGSVDYGAYQANALPQADIDAGYALFCCARPQSDVVIECREVGAAKDIQIKTLPCRVQVMDKRADDVMVLQLKLPANERLQFLAGQYIDILLRDGRRRSFSIANAPHNDEFLELHIRHMPGGHFTGHVFEKMKEKDLLRFEGPLGTFFLREGEEYDKPIIFVAGGTGFAPIKGMLEHAFHVHDRREMVLYWGVRSLQDLYMAELPAKWQAEHPNFTFIPVLSEAKPEDNWQGRTGFVHEAVVADFDDLSGFEVYACGNPMMVEATHKGLSAKGLKEGSFYSDAFLFEDPSKGN